MTDKFCVVFWQLFTTKMLDFKGYTIIIHFNMTQAAIIGERLQVLTSHMGFNPGFTTRDKAKFMLL